MSRQVSHDGLGGLQIRFPFDRSLVDLIKTLPSRRWNAQERYWSVPETDLVSLVDLLHERNFNFDSTTRELYYRMGGSARLQEESRPTNPTLPGLFDEPEVAGETVTGRSAGDYTVEALNEKVRSVLESAFPSTIWLVGEISGFNKSAHRRHASFQFVQLEQSGKSVSQVSATLFERTRKMIERSLRDAGDPFRLEDEVEVRVLVRVELYVPWGSYRVIVEDLDVNYTLGEAARRREEIIRRLTEAGLVGLNPALPLPAFPLRVGLITSLGSDAYNDVLRTLQESGLAFELTAHGARVQGRQTEPSVLNALDWFHARQERFDAVMICRGGGSRTDLAWFDSEQLGRAVAGFPLPVIVGIGHEQDHSVLDVVGRRAKTPTAAAGLLVKTVQQSLEQIEAGGERVLALATQAIREESRRSIERGGRLVRAGRNLVQQEVARLGEQRQRAVIGARATLSRAREGLIRWITGIPRSASLHVRTRRLVLSGTLRAVGKAAARDLATVRGSLRQQARLLAPRSARLLSREQQNAESYERRLRLIDPRRVIERGYAILRLDDGTVLTRASRAPAGTAVQAELRRGSLRLRSEGEGDD